MWSVPPCSHLRSHLLQSYPLVASRHPAYAAPSPNPPGPLLPGPRAVREPAWAERMARRHPGRVVLGIDARDGKVATEGWLAGTDTLAIDFVRAVSKWPLAAIVHTDIARDGMLAGPNLEATAEL